MNNDTAVHANLELEYSQINDNIRALADIRFKLLSLIPALGGAGIFVLSRTGLETYGKPGSADTDLVVVLFVGIIGFVATLGIILYDQRNSELYNALIHRARHLELAFKVPGSPGGLKAVSSGGQFRERPQKRRRLFLTAGHDLALALIYGPLLGAWLFPVTYTAARLATLDQFCAKFMTITVTFLTATLFSARLNCARPRGE